MKVELLAPAGSIESMKAAYAAGADAVYIGGSRFGARAYADNPDNENLKEAIDYAHLKGKQLYLTVNTLLKDAELEELYDYLNPYYRQGLDAVIVQDLGVFRKVRQCFPDMDIHASTQMTVTGADGAGLLKELGASRVVTAREMSLTEIKKIHDAVDIEIESFVHGALCYCYSGQCLFSSMIGGRSGNRGRCAQPCRLPYEWEQKRMQKENSYLLSPKDLCTLDLIPALVESGIYSFKIEGRMKRPEYTAGVTRIYRKYIDRYLQQPEKPFRVEEADKRELMDLYNRGGFTDGYYCRRNGPEMMAAKRPNHQGILAAGTTGSKNGRVQMRASEELHAGDVLELSAGGIMQEFTVKETVKAKNTFSAAFRQKLPQLAPGTKVYRTHNAYLLELLKKTYVDAEIPEKINGKLILSLEKPAILSVSFQGQKVTVQGAEPLQALNRPLLMTDAEKQVRKTGGSGFCFQNLEIIMEDGLFLPMQALNELRRNALEALKKQVLETYRRTEGIRPEERNLEKKQQDESCMEVKNRLTLTVSLESLDAFADVCNAPEVERIYIDGNAFAARKDFLENSVKIAEQCRAHQKQCFYIMPWIFRDRAEAYYAGDAAAEALASYDGLLIRNLEELVFWKTRVFSKPAAADWNLYTWNREAAAFFAEYGVDFNTVSPELNRWEMQERGIAGSELIVYGKQPLMVSAQCQVKNLQGCTGKPSVHYLTDRKKKKFAVKNNCAFCYNTIYNSAVLDLSDCREEIRKLNPKSLRLQFTTETPQEILQIIRMYGRVFLEGREAGRISKEYTRGHFARKVE